MEVKETAGEVSASIEETNRVRAALGMAPLKEGVSKSSKEDEAKANGRERAEAALSEAAEDALRDKIDKQRRQRLLHQKLSGKSLGEQLAGDEMDSAAAWVAKSRNQEVDRKERRKEARVRRPAPSALASQSARYDEEDELEQQSALAGAVVGHGLDEFKAGEDVVLTLADQQVVDTAEDGAYQLNEGDEMLENVNLTEDWRRQRNKDLASGAGHYNPYENDGTSGVLGKYDEERGRTTVQLDSSGGVDEAKQKKCAPCHAGTLRAPRRPLTPRCWRVARRA